jgi:hypothetical protein
MTSIGSVTAPTTLLPQRAVNSTPGNARQFEIQTNFTVKLSPGGTNANNSSGSSRSAAVPFTAGVRLLLGAGAWADVVLQGEANPSGTLTALNVSVDRSRAGGCFGGPVIETFLIAQAFPVQMPPVLYCVSVSVFVLPCLLLGSTASPFHIGLWLVPHASTVWSAGNATNTTFIEGGPVPLPVGTNSAWSLPDQQLGLSIWVDHTVLEVYAMRGLARVTSRVYPEDNTADFGVAVFGGGASSGSGGLLLPTGGPVGGDLTFEGGDQGGGVNGSSGGVTVGADVQVWGVDNMWLPPSC